MPDLSKLSDSDLEAVSRGDLHSVSDEGLSVLAQPDPSQDARSTGEKVKAILFGGQPTPGETIGADQLHRQELSKYGSEEGIKNAYKENLPAAAAASMGPFVPLPEVGSAATAAEKGLAALGRIGVSTGTGAAIGALTPGDRTKNAERGAALGLIPSVTAEGIGAAASWLGDKAQLFSHERALKAAGATAADFRKINDKENLEELGGYLLDNSHVAAGSTTRSISESLESARENAGKAIGNIIDSVDRLSQPSISARDIALELSEDPEIQKLATIPGSEAVANSVDGYLNTLYKNGENMSLKQAQELRQGIDKNINLDKTLRDLPEGQAMLGKIRNAISDKMKEAVDAFDASSGGVASGRLAQANDAYNKLSELSRISAKRVVAESANRGLILTDYISGAAGSATGAKIGSYLTGEDGSHNKIGIGAILGGSIGALGNKAVRTYGNGLLASGANSFVVPVADAAASVPSYAPTLTAILAGTKKQEEPAKTTAVQRRLSGKESK